ncbi:MAG: alpha/beta hydrolase [Gammaproteobacteria bacterium]|nr:alpha/beta hydrolase [Gammaproteobacteria bacterium]
MNQPSNKTPLVLLCGLLCDRLMWQEVGTLLDDVAEVSIFSFAGFDSISQMAAHVLASSPEQFALAGHSMGGRVAFEIIRQAPQRVTQLAFLNTGVHPRSDKEVPGRQRLLDLSRDAGMAAVADSWLPPMLSHTAKQKPELVEQLRQMVLRHSTEDFHGQIQALLNRPDAEQVLSQVRVPTLLMSGTEDQWSPVAQHQAIQQQIPGSRLVVLDGVGHMSTVEAPGQIAGAMRNWLIQQEQG